MLSADENERLVRIGPDDPAGRLLRQYWHPVFPAEALSAPRAKLPFELLGEQLVAYRMSSGEIGVTPARCPHRGASLAFGYVEPNGLRCAYHGWLFDRATGRCIERPFESAGQTERCDLPAYNAVEVAGLIFVSLRPQGPPPFPMWDILAHDSGGYRIDTQADLSCNYLQVQENAADVTHTFFLHSRALEEKGLADGTGFNAPLREFGFQPFDYGLVKSWTYEGEDGALLEGWGNPLIFPTMLSIETEMHWRVPINDTKTRVIILRFEPEGSGVTVNELPSRYDEDGHYTMLDFYSQDAMAWETQGAIADRTTETLGASDIGIVMYRRMLSNGIEAVERGEAPPAQGGDGVINLRAWMNGYLPMTAPADPSPTERYDRDQVFDSRHRTHRVPVPGAVTH